MSDTSVALVSSHKSKDVLFIGSLTKYGVQRGRLNLKGTTAEYPALWKTLGLLLGLDLAVLDN